MPEQMISIEFSEEQKSHRDDKYGSSEVSLAPAGLAAILNVDLDSGAKGSN